MKMLKPFLLLLMMTTCFVRVEACTPSPPSSGPCCMYLFVYCDAMSERKMMKMNILATSLVGFYKTGFQLIALDSGSGNICCMYLCACLMKNMKNYVLGNWRAINILTHPCNDLPLCRFLSMMVTMTMTMTMTMTVMVITRDCPKCVCAHNCQLR